MDSKKNNNKHNVNSVAAGLTGAVIGAGVAVAGTAILKNEKNRAQLKKILNSAKQKVKEYAADTEKDLKQKKGVIKKELLAKGRTTKIAKAM